MDEVNAVEDPRRSRLVDEAAELFFSVGAAAVTMDRVAAAAGMSKKTVYQVVESKSVLLTAVVEQLFDRIDADVQAVVAARQLSARQRVIGVVEAAGRHLGALGAPQAELRRVDPAAWSAATALRHRAVEEPLDEVLALAARRGELHAAVDPQLARFVVLRVIEMLASSDVTAATGMTVGQVLQQVVRMFVDGLFDRDRTTGADDRLASADDEG